MKTYQIMRISITLTNYKTYQGLYKQLWCTAIIVFVALASSVSAFAQVNLPSEDRCTSKDLELVSARLDTGKGPCIDCEPEEEIVGDLYLAIANKTGSTRTSFAFWGTLVVTNADGTPAGSVSITGCEGPIPRDDTKELPFDVEETGPGSDFIENGQIVIECGQTLELVDIFLAWTDASPKSVCPLNPALIAPKCGTLPSIDISTGLSAVVEEKTEISCAGNDGAVDVTVTGGTPPYTYQWTASNGGVIPSGQADDQDLSGLVAGTYTLLVTDAEDCTADLEVTFQAPTPPATPIFTIQAATLCEGPSTPTITICNPQVGVSYTVRQRDETDVVVGPYTEGALVIGGLAAGKDFALFGTLGECTSATVSCDDEATPTECRDAAAVRMQSSSTSSLKAVKDPESNKLTAYPVPFRSKVNVEFNSERNGNYAINLYDSKGKLIKELKAGKAKAGQLQTIEVDGRSLPDGMYFIRVVDSSGSRTVKLLKKE